VRINDYFCVGFTYIFLLIYKVLSYHQFLYEMTTSPHNTYAEAYDSEWRQFLYQYYTDAWEHSQGTVSLEEVYPIAKKKFETRNKECDIELNLMANKRKHKKVEKYSY